MGKLALGAEVNKEVQDKLERVELKIRGRLLDYGKVKTL